MNDAQYQRLTRRLGALERREGLLAAEFDREQADRGRAGLR
jgi:hypothetical protein